jgi:subtilisin family serine protease
MRRLPTTLRPFAAALGLLLLTPALGRTDAKKPFVDPLLLRMMRGSPAAVAKGARPGTLNREELGHYRRIVAIDDEIEDPVVRVRLRLDAAARQSIERLGIMTYGRMEGFASASVPVRRLEEVAALPGIEVMQAVRIPELELDMSRVNVRSNELAATYGGNGQGVIVGSIDTGVDWRHQDFRKADGTTRIKYIWSLDDACVGTPPPVPFNFGCLYTESQINAALTGGPTITAPDADGHGTNTLGVSAGNGRATGNGWPAGRYVGMAPEADIIVVKVFPEPGDSSSCPHCYDIGTALDFIDAKAAELGKPYVVNISLGQQLGGHDGSDLDEMTIDTLTGPGIPGKAIVKSAGNERLEPIHIGGTVAAGQTIDHIFTIPQYTALPGIFNDVIAWQVWYSAGDTLTVSIVDPTTAPCGGAATTLSASTGQGQVFLNHSSGTMIIDDSASPAPNGARFFDLEIDDQFGSAPCRGNWTFRVRGNTITAGGRYDAWIWISTFGSSGLEAFWVLPDYTRLISVPGTSFNGTTVAAYVSRQSWRSIDGQMYQYGDPPPALGTLASFSSPGPSRDGRVKPDIAAPGWTSLSALSQNAAPSVDPRIIAEDGQHWALTGTSFASPHVAGIYAQMLGLNRALDAIELRTLIRQTARVDAQTGAVPNNNWGYGKVDAKAAADLLVKPIPDLMANADAQTFSASSIPGASTYNIYRGNLSLVSPTYYGTCFASGLPSPGFSDTATLIAGAGFFYYATGVKDGIEGMLGFSWDGTISKPRPNNSPCP